MRRTAVSLAFAVALLVAPAQAAVKKMFITSVSGNAKLGNWPIIAGQGFSGADAGDAICQALAASASLDNADKFRAWLSTTGDDAFCRVRTLTGGGTKSGRCGGIDPIIFSLSKAGPWVRTDNYPFSLDEIALTSNGAVMTPGLFDEHGVAVNTIPVRAWTGTENDGTAYFGTCGDWTTTPSDGATLLGDAAATTGDWSHRTTGACDESYHLYCFETGTGGDPLPSFETPGALAFVTSWTGTGDLSSWPLALGTTGVTAGDTICRFAARLADLPWPGSFKAWLSTSTANAIDRLSLDGPWKRVDGVRVASSKQNLVLAKPFGTINQDENGDYVGEQVWTGTNDSGKATLQTCDDWTGSSGDGYAGNSNSSLIYWTANGPHPCDEAIPRHLYCFSDVVIDFWDGFEGGTTKRWSAKTP
jgi:hypothetical protein